MFTGLTYWENFKGSSVLVHPVFKAEAMTDLLTHCIHALSLKAPGTVLDSAHKRPNSINLEARMKSTKRGDLHQNPGQTPAAVPPGFSNTASRPAVLNLALAHTQGLQLAFPGRALGPPSAEAESLHVIKSRVAETAARVGIPQGALHRSARVVGEKGRDLWGAGIVQSSNPCLG